MAETAPLQDPTQDGEHRFESRLSMIMNVALVATNIFGCYVESMPNVMCDLQMGNVLTFDCCDQDANLRYNGKHSERESDQENQGSQRCLFAHLKRCSDGNVVRGVVLPTWRTIGSR